MREPGAKRLFWYIFTLSPEKNVLQNRTPGWTRPQSLVGHFVCSASSAAPGFWSWLQRCGQSPNGSTSSPAPRMAKTRRSSNCGIGHHASTPQRSAESWAQLLQPQQGAHSSEPNVPPPTGIIRLWLQAAQTLCRCPVSSLRRFDDYVGYSFIGAYALSAVQCASREAEETRGYNGDSNWHWHTSRGVRRLCNAPFFTGSEQTGASQVGFDLLKSHWVQGHLPQVREARQCSPVRRWPLRTERMTLKVIKSRTSALNCVIAPLGSHYWPLVVSELNWRELLRRQRDDKSKIGDWSGWQRQKKKKKNSGLMKCVSDDLVERRSRPSHCVLLWLRCDTVSFLSPCCIFSASFIHLTFKTLEIPIAGHNWHIL